MDDARPVIDAEVNGGHFSWWDAYHLVVAVAVAAATLLTDSTPPWRRLLAAGAVAARMALRFATGPLLMRAGRPANPVLAVLLGKLVLFTVAVAATPFTTWLLFALIPMIFQLASTRRAVVLVIVANVITPAVDLVEWPGQLRVDLTIALISSAAGIWLGTFIHRVIDQNTERGILIRELEASRAEVGRLSHKAGVAAERARLAGEIHDTLAQGFTSIITLLQAADPQLRDERLALAVRTARENLAEARALVAALAPAALGAGSLADSVRRQAARFTEETGTPAAVRVTGDERALPTKVEVVLLRAAQEALTNVRRHAAATEAGVLLAYAPESVRLVVRDDGRGFDPRPAADPGAAGDSGWGSGAGFGLAGMQARAEQVGGTLSVRSAPATGTTIELEVPV